MNKDFVEALALETSGMKPEVAVLHIFGSIQARIMRTMTEAILGEPDERDRGYIHSSPSDATNQERLYQIETYGEAHDNGHSYAEMALVLSAEVGEAMQALKVLTWPDEEVFDFGDQDFEMARSELIQVAATAQAIVEMIDFHKGWPIERESNSDDIDAGDEDGPDKTDGFTIGHAFDEIGIPLSSILASGFDPLPGSPMYYAVQSARNQEQEGQVVDALAIDDETIEEIRWQASRDRGISLVYSTDDIKRIVRIAMSAISKKANGR
jgi:hypothetical protein